MQVSLFQCRLRLSWLRFNPDFKFSFTSESESVCKNKLTDFRAYLRARFYGVSVMKHQIYVSASTEALRILPLDKHSFSEIQPVQSNLSTMATLRTGHFGEVSHCWQLKEEQMSRLGRQYVTTVERWPVWGGRPLWRGGHCGEVVTAGR